MRLELTIDLRKFLRQKEPSEASRMLHHVQFQRQVTPYGNKRSIMRAREPRQLRQCNILEYHNISPIKLQISASAIKKALDHLSRTPRTSSRKMEDIGRLCLPRSLENFRAEANPETRRRRPRRRACPGGRRPLPCGRRSAPSPCSPRFF